MNTMHAPVARLDLGRILMVPLSALVVLRNAFSILRIFQSPTPLHALDILSQLNTTLVTCFYVLMVVAYLWRRPARQTSPSFAVNAVAVIATFFPALLLAVGVDVPGSWTQVLCGTVMATAGIGFSVYSLHELGRSFSIIPQSRELVASGPYRYLRHPLYVAEIVAMAGFVLAHLTMMTVAIFVTMVCMQVYRAMREEGILASTFPAYEAYMARTWRFLPRIF